MKSVLFVLFSLLTELLMAQQKQPVLLNDSLLMENDSSMFHTYLQRARQRVEGHYYKGALEDYTAALKLYPTDAELWLQRGITKEKSKDMKGAVADYTEAIRLDSTSVTFRIFRGNLWSKEGKYHEALLDYNNAIRLNASNAIAYYQRALIHKKLRLDAEACADLKKAEDLGMVLSEQAKQGICHQ